MKVAIAALLMGSLLVLANCKKEDEAPTSLAPSLSKGKQIYAITCAVCHAGDPKKDGPVGPAIWGSSQELIRMRVLESKYPDGYTPKRQTHAMPQFPQFKNDIESLYLFLNSNE